MLMSVCFNEQYPIVCVSLWNYVKYCALNYDKTLLTIPILFFK